MKAQKCVRVATLGKVQRDGQNIMNYARFAIVLRGGVPELIDNGNLRKQCQPFAHLIAVIGPAHHLGTFVPEAVLLEIGYSRTRPYSQLEQLMAAKGGEKFSKPWSLKGRTRVRKISDPELQAVYPMIERCMAEIVLECRETWKNKGRWWVHGPGLVERGIRFTFDKSDRSLYRQMLLEDIRLRKEKYIRGHARRISRLIGGYRRADYSKQQLERFPGVERVAELLREQTYYSPFYRRVLLECFKPDSHTRILLERLNRMFRFGLEEESEYATVVYGTDGPAFGSWKFIRARVVDQPTKHAKNGLVVEVTIERNCREENEVSP